MSVREIRASGREGMALATDLLQRARLADPLAGVWEAADVQWWSRKPRASDDIEQVFWTDADGPVAGVYLTSWGEELWECAPLTVAGAPSPDTDEVWSTALAQIAAHAVGVVEVPVHGADVRLADLAVEVGLVPGEQSSSSWMDAADRPAVVPPPDGFVVTDRSVRQGTSHPMRERNGDAVEEHLRRCSLYDPELDLAVETADGQTAGYSLFWFDPVTGTGLVEPVRVEDEYARRGLARAMLTVGIDRLAHRGARRIKIGFGSEAASALYQGLGFRPTSLDTWYTGRVEDVAS